MHAHASIVVLSPHDAAWSATARRESLKFQAALGEILIAVHHIGSTAIPGICAKPIIDLLPVVTDLASFDHASEALTQLGYQPKGEFGIPGRRYFTLESPTGERLVHVHAFAEGDPNITCHLAFRDYMIDHPDESRAYEAEKRRCRDLHPNDSRAYSEAKSAWILDAEQRALRWHKARGG